MKSCKQAQKYQIPLFKWPTRQKLIMVQNCPGSPASFSLIGFSPAVNLGANSKATGSTISFFLCKMSVTIVELYLMTKCINLLLKKQLGWCSGYMLLLVLL